MSLKQCVGKNYLEQNIDLSQRFPSIECRVLSLAPICFGCLSHLADKHGCKVGYRLEIHPSLTNQAVRLRIMLRPTLMTAIQQRGMIVCQKCWAAWFSKHLKQDFQNVYEVTSHKRPFQTSSAAFRILSDPENKGQSQRGVNFDTLGSWNNRLSLSILMEESIKKGKLIPKIPLTAVGSASFIGRRRVNEDRMVVKELEKNLLYVGIFDGHSSSFAADYVVEYLEHHIRYWLSKNVSMEVVLHKSFIDVHNVLARHLTHYFMNTETFTTGTTATVCLIRDSSEMVVANVGDSRAVLCRKGEALRLSHDDDPEDPMEFARVTQLGGKIVQNSQGMSQVNGRLGMTRSIGDTELKSFGVVAEPHLKSLEIKHGYDAFLMLATDGLCYVLSDEEMINIISSCQTPKEAAGRVADQALHFGSEDNSSVLVVPFGAWGKYISSARSLQYRFGRNMVGKRD